MSVTVTLPRVGDFISLQDERYLLCAIKYEPQEPPSYKLMDRNCRIVWMDQSQFIEKATSGI